MRLILKCLRLGVALNCLRRWIRNRCRDRHSKRSGRASLGGNPGTPALRRACGCSNLTGGPSCGWGCGGEQMTIPESNCVAWLTESSPRREC